MAKRSLADVIILNPTEDEVVEIDTSRMIDANGEASRNEVTAHQVAALVYPTANLPDPIPGMPPADAVTMSPQGSAEWEFPKPPTFPDRIPGSECSMTEPYTENTLVVWAIFPTGPASIATVNFKGKCNNNPPGM